VDYTWGCPMHWRTFSTDLASTHKTHVAPFLPVMRRKMSPDFAKCSLGGEAKLLLIESPCPRL